MILPFSSFFKMVTYTILWGKYREDRGWTKEWGYDILDMLGGFGAVFFVYGGMTVRIRALVEAAWIPAMFCTGRCTGEVQHRGTEAVMGRRHRSGDPSVRRFG